MGNSNINGIMTVILSGRIDSVNSPEVEKKITSELEGEKFDHLVLDAEKLEYISSSGLRIILRLKKSYGDIKLINVNSDVYEILDVTGFTEMMTVEKAYRVISVEGCEVIGEGANGKVYRIDQDNVVKTYKNADALSEIQHEREVARLALILGVPTAISYDVVRVGDSYGSVFELLNARSFAKILAAEPERIDWCVKEYVNMLKKIHSIEVPEGKLPHIKDNAVSYTERTKNYIPAEKGKKLLAMVKSIPESNHMIHGDYHTKNIVLAGDEVLIIDMDTLSVGNPVFELAQMYNSYIGFSENDPSVVLKFQGFSQDIAREFWKKSLKAYIGSDDPEKFREADDKVRCVSYSYLIDWKHRHSKNGMTDEDIQLLDLWTGRLLEILDRIDDLDLGV